MAAPKKKTKVVEIPEWQKNYSFEGFRPGWGLNVGGVGLRSDILRGHTLLTHHLNRKISSYKKNNPGKGSALNVALSPLTINKNPGEGVKYVPLDVHSLQYDNDEAYKKAWDEYTSKMTAYQAALHKYNQRAQNSSDKNPVPPVAPVAPRAMNTFDGIEERLAENFLKAKKGWVKRRLQGQPASYIPDSQHKVAYAAIPTDENGGQFDITLVPGFYDISNEDRAFLKSVLGEEGYSIAHGHYLRDVIDDLADDYRNPDSKGSIQDRISRIAGKAHVDDVLSSSHFDTYLNEDNRSRNIELASAVESYRKSRSQPDTGVNEVEGKPENINSKDTTTTNVAVNNSYKTNFSKNIFCTNFSKKENTFTTRFPKKVFTTNFSESKKKMEKRLEELLRERSMGEVGEGYGSENPYLADVLAVGVAPAIANKIVSTKKKLSKYDKLAENDAIVSQSAKSAGLMGLIGAGVGAVGGGIVGWKNNPNINDAMFGAQVGAMGLGGLGALLGGVHGALKGKKIAKKRRDEEKRLILKALEE